MAACAGRGRQQPGGHANAAAEPADDSTAPHRTAL